MRKRFIRDLDECGTLWNQLVRPGNISDLWEFRLCFRRHFRCRPCFLVLEDNKGTAGMLPLSFSEEADGFVFFPGETWKGKTWMERTPVYLREAAYLDELFSSCPEKAYLRYMNLPQCPFGDGFEVDEIGYVLYPSRFHFDPALYGKRFSSKKFKTLLKTIRSLAGEQARFHLNRIGDFDLLVDMSLKHFGNDSYLDDPRFREGFRDVMHLLLRRGWLRMVSLEISGETVAVDMGAVFRGTYTVFLGGTDRQIPGLAKVMNMHHIEYACQQGLSKIDFLCGDFHWKKLWHLDPEPLYKFVRPSQVVREPDEDTFFDEAFGLVERAQLGV